MDDADIIGHGNISWHMDVERPTPGRGHSRRQRIEILSMFFQLVGPQFSHR